MSIFICLAAASAEAGFWSSVAGGVVANSISNSGGKSAQNGLDRAQSPEMKMQQALYGLGYYDGRLDGNLNTLDSRTAIQAFQKNNKTKDSGILAEENRQHLLYIHELYELLLDTKTTEQKKSEIYDEIDKVQSLMGGKG
jgi:peptidoglycan hydrolase-like protein with peptidoglycan-binding domain